MPHILKTGRISATTLISENGSVTQRRRGAKFYSIDFSFEYKITNHGVLPLHFFNVYSDIYDGINCVQIFYDYTFRDELLPGESILLYGSGYKYRTTSNKTFEICLRVVAPDLELDRNPADNTSCKNLVHNDDLNSIESGFQIYPNPVDDIMHISKESPGDFKIYNSFGKLIRELKNKNNFEINMSNLKAGIYYIVDTSVNMRIFSKKFIKL